MTTAGHRRPPAGHDSPHRARVRRTATRWSMPASRSGSGRWCSGSWSARSRCSGMWSAATATYFAFRDDVLTRLIARQAEMQYAYEDRIAELARQGRSHHQPPIARSGTIRPEARTDHAPSDHAGIPRHARWAPFPTAVTGSIRSPSRGAAAAEPPASGYAKTITDQRHRGFRCAAGSRSAAGIPRAGHRQRAGDQARKNPGRRQCDRAPANLARPGRAAPARCAQLA